MRLVRLITMPLLVLLAISAASAPTALAVSTNNPKWSLCLKNEKGKFEAGCEAAGKSFEVTALGEGESQESKASGVGTQELTITGIGTIQMKKLKFAAAATVKGSKQPNAGTGEQVIEFEEASVKGFPECKVEQGKKVTLKTNALKDKLAYQTKAAAEKEEAPVVTVLEPAAGKTFMEFELTGSCPVTGTLKVEGSLVAENVEGTKYKEKLELRAPAVGIQKYFVNEAGKTVEVKAELKAAGVKAGFLLIGALAIGALLIFASTAR